jgi:anthranilate/para-aminobenzoate synthase component II
MADFTLAPKQILLNLINADNPLHQLESADVTFEAPVATPEGSRNTSIVVIPGPFSPYDNRQSFYYNRLDLGAVFNTLSTVFEKTSEVNTLEDVVALVNARWAVNLTPDDVTLSPFPAFEGNFGESHTITFTVRSSSLNFIGVGVITLAISVEKIPLDEAFPNNVLNGLVYAPPA